MDLSCFPNSVWGMFSLIHCWSAEGPGGNPKISWLLKQLYTGNSVFEASTTALFKSICSPTCKTLQTWTYVNMAAGVSAPRSYSCAWNCPFILNLLWVQHQTPTQQHKAMMADHHDHVGCKLYTGHTEQDTLPHLDIFKCSFVKTDVWSFGLQNYCNADIIKTSHLIFRGTPSEPCD